MNSRSDRRSRNPDRFPRPSGKKSKRNDSFDQRASSKRPRGDRNVYRSKIERAESQEVNDFSNTRERYGSRGDYKRDRRNLASSGEGRGGSRSDFLRRDSQRSLSKSNIQRRVRRFTNGEGSSSSSEIKRRARQNDQSNNSFKPQVDDERYGKSSPNDFIWGRHSTQAALESGRPIHRIWCTPELRTSQKFLQLLRDAKSSGVLVEEVTWARLGQLTNGAVHQGIVLQPAAAEALDLPSLIEGCENLDESPLLLALDGLTDPQNLGAIVRSAEALGAHGLVLPQRRSAGLTGSVAKVAAGALEHLPVARVVNLNRSLEDLKKAGYRIIGLAEEGDVTLQEMDFEGPLVVVTGSEGKGISLVTRRHCDQLVRIPLRGVTKSLNASVATALCLYEVARTSWMKGLSGQAPSPRIVRAQFASTFDSEKGSDKEEEGESFESCGHHKAPIESDSSSIAIDSENNIHIDLNTRNEPANFEDNVQL